VTVGMVAEGIETQEELKVVRELGIDLVQGYLLGKPKAFKSPSRPPRSRVQVIDRKTAAVILPFS
jgi:EAL domain-containing protein (putative c-di-GMP-specific phosphodiesterase class I)